MRLLTKHNINTKAPFLPELQGCLRAAACKPCARSGPAAAPSRCWRLVPSLPRPREAAGGQTTLLTARGASMHCLGLPSPFPKNSEALRKKGAATTAQLSDAFVCFFKGGLSYGEREGLNKRMV